MTAAQAAIKQQDDPKTLIIERVFDAPPARIFKAWTNEQDTLMWGGPRQWPIVATKADVRVGGSYRSTLRNIDTGEELYHGGVYLEIDEPELLSFTFMWDDGHPETNVETVITIRLEDIGNGQTKMHFHQSPFVSLSNRDGHIEGWTSAFDRLDDLIAI